MRMWMVDPSLMCLKHLCGEHGEIHKHRHNFVKQHKMSGRIKTNALEPLSMQIRHDALEKEINKRQKQEGRKITNSPFLMPDVSYLPSNELNYQVDIEKSFKLLFDRCIDCRKRMIQLDIH